MKNERELLTLFYDSDNCREVLRQPFLQDGKVCASDGHVLIRIDSSLCEGSYDEKPGGLTPPRTASVVPAVTTDIAVTRQQIERALEQAPEEQNRQCPECKGSGDVTWEYCDRYCDIHRMEEACPVCDGSGTVDDYTVIKYQFIVCGKALGYHAVKTLLDAMSLLDIDTIRLVNADAEPMLFKPENMDVEILLMPQIRDEKLDCVSIMAKTIISRKQAISDLRELFELPAEGKRQDDDGCSFCSEKENDTADFCIDKKHFERYEVLQKLSKYFADKMIDGGRCRVGNITFVWTQFWIELVKKEEEA